VSTNRKKKRREKYRILIQEVFDKYHQVLGAGKIRTILRQRGNQVSTKFVADLMREMGLTSVPTTAKQDYLKFQEPEKKKNVLRQQFHADRPNQIWVSDITCFKLGKHYLYTCVILDIFMTMQWLSLSSLLICTFRSLILNFLLWPLTYGISSKKACNL